MKLLLTSFGIEQGLPQFRIPSKYPKSPFYRMPPVNMAAIGNEFIPDYSVLLLCERAIFDHESFEHLSRGQNPQYRLVAESLKALHSEGFLELVDYSSVLQPEEKRLSRMLEGDLKQLAQWRTPLLQSAEIWQEFCRHWQSERFSQDADSEAASSLADIQTSVEHSSVHSVHVFPQDARARHYGSSRLQERVTISKQVASSYLAYVNANIVLSNALGIGIHDWADFFPLYRQKFLAIGQDGHNNQRQVQEVKKLFEVSFPEFTIHDIRTFIQILNDPRIHDLRKLVEEAANGRVQFDHDFARRILHEVIRNERKGKERRLTSYLTTLAFQQLRRFLKHDETSRDDKQYQWFYLLSETVHKSDLLLPIIRTDENETATRPLHVAMHRVVPRGEITLVRMLMPVHRALHVPYQGVIDMPQHETTQKVFIGHGKSAAWKDLKDFLSDRLNLDWDEFNRETSAGLSTIERLTEMMDHASFAFLVLTAEDERVDGSRHARENVIHELGLFQGRLGFRRAIVVLEEGCEEFSNIHGLTQIRFPKGNIMAKSEEVRAVLERENLL